MQAEERFKRLLAATPDKLAAVDAVLEDRADTPKRSIRVYRLGEAARAIGISRLTLWRALREKRVIAVELRRGSYRISEEELRRFVGVS